MTDELKVGDRASTCFHEVTIIAIDGTVAFVRDEAGGNWCDHLAAFTRISPAVPQPKYRVGQKVRYGKRYGRILSLHTEAYVEVEDGPGTTHDPPEHAMWKVQNLEALPVCSTCGGKVG